MKNTLLFVVILAAFSCQQDEKSSVEELFEADRQFSNAAEMKGFRKAFVEFAHADAVLLRENRMPVVGKPAIKDLFSGESPQNIQFFWQPLNGEVAVSGELGYTYGIYTIKSDSVVQKGTYISVWKKDKDGNWKYILDSGNEGIGE
ncbi:DUF4440 domain-containing protein [Maribellus comscasis]|uniref:DUF4440 domain-containing protein n=1 Tax=Maribellus comscasis TaxID=2681766 RepID=A0A6I6JVI9_9BACT|nr:DUF4440 domain-containing protein [Maribellus comscasis]QGY47165.1 DUF4440 domain-containing protein [Maribellus comscasis]